jgi:hypothetical protein
MHLQFLGELLHKRKGYCQPERNDEWQFQSEPLFFNKKIDEEKLESQKDSYPFSR